MIAALTSHQVAALGWCSGIMTLWVIAVITHILAEFKLVYRSYVKGPDVPPMIVGGLIGLLPAICVGIVVGFFA